MSYNQYAPPQSNVDTSSHPPGAVVEESCVSFENLTSANRWRFVWGFFWRSLCIAVLSMLGGAVAGAVIGFVTVAIAQAFGKSLADAMTIIRILSGTAGLLVGFASLWLLLRWCFRASWFGYRLRLVKDVD